MSPVQALLWEVPGSPQCRSVEVNAGGAAGSVSFGVTKLWF